MNCIKNGKLTDDTCFGCEIDAKKCDMLELLAAKNSGRILPPGCYFAVTDCGATTIVLGKGYREAMNHA